MLVGASAEAPTPLPIILHTQNAYICTLANPKEGTQTEAMGSAVLPWVSMVTA